MDVSIPWDLGFDKKAKHAYVAALHIGLNKKMPDKMISEVTTACPDEFGRMLSPYNIIVNGVSLEDMWKTAKVNGYSDFYWGSGNPSVGFDHFYAYYALYLLPLIRRIDIFTDIFYNPMKAHNTQARACAVLKLLAEENKLKLLQDKSEYVRWYINATNNLFGGE